MNDDAGVLWVVGTPIGNAGDMSRAAQERLGAVDVICAEDTRRTRRLLAALGIPARRLVSVRAENESQSIARVGGWIAQGKSVALVSDAGMPAISDPGQRLIAGLLALGHRVKVQPGPDSVTAAIAASGTAGDRWCFEGFLPRRGSERRQRIESISGERRAVVIFESPRRVVATLSELAVAVGADRPVAVVNDLTKPFARIWRGSLAHVATELADTEPLGEFVIVIGPVRATS